MFLKDLLIVLPVLKQPIIIVLLILVAQVKLFAEVFKSDCLLPQLFV